MGPGTPRRAGLRRRESPRPLRGVQPAVPDAGGPARMNPVNLGAKLATFSELMVVKAQGELVWRKHDDPHDFFLVLAIEPAGTPNTGDPATAAARRVI